MLKNVLNKFPIISVIDYKSENDNLFSGFQLVLTTEKFPIVEMGKNIDLIEFRKFWRLMGYQVTEIERKTLIEWKKIQKNESEYMKDFKNFNFEINNLSKKTIDSIENEKTINNNDIDSSKKELNEHFRKFIISYKIFSNILFFDTKKLNVINKGKMEFVVKKDDVEKVKKFYEDNKVNYSTSNLELSDLYIYSKLFKTKQLKIKR
jgi:hypothetical protein